MNLADKFDFEMEVSKASELIKNVISKATLAVPDDACVKKNTSVFTTWLAGLFFEEFRKKIGFNEETSKFWPGRDECDILLKKLD